MAHKLVKYRLNENGTIPDFVLHGHPHGVQGFAYVPDDTVLPPRDGVMLCITVDNPTGMFEEIELRKQAEDNRQSSEEVFDPKLPAFDYIGVNIPIQSSSLIKGHLVKTQRLYNDLLEKGVSRETARMVLPMCTKTKIYMTGPVRSWIHFFSLRDDSHAQKEIQLLAKEGKKIFIKQFPIISKALDYGRI